MKTPRPRISVVIPTHNRALSLKACLQSLEIQTLPHRHFEVIVVDDASQDETPALVAEMTPSYPFHYVRRREGGSAAAARNQGAAVAQSDIILFLDDDVVPTPQLLEAHLGVHRRWGRVSVLGYSPFSRDLPRTPIMEYHRARWDEIFSRIATYDVQKEIPFNFFITINLSVRRADFEGLGPFNSILKIVFEDTELGLRFAEAGVPLKFCKDALAWHHPSLGEDSLTSRPERFGYRAGHYYLRHPNNKAMNKCMNVAYVFGLPSSRHAFARMRSFLRRNLLSDWSVSVLMSIVLRMGHLLPAPVRNFICAKVKWYHYSKGFRRALLEAGEWQDSLKTQAQVFSK